MADRTTTRRELTLEESDVVIEWTLGKAKAALGLADEHLDPTLDQWLEAFEYIKRAVKLMPPARKRAHGLTTRGTSKASSSDDG